MLYGEVVSETAQELTFRVASKLGDAPTFGIVGTITAPKRACRLKRRGPRREFDQLKLPVAELERIGKACIVFDD